MNWYGVAEKLGFAAGGAFVALVCAFYAVGKDLSFLKGQMTMILTQLDLVRRLKEAVIELRQDVAKAKHDLNSAFEKIRTLENKEATVNGHGD